MLGINLLTHGPLGDTQHPNYNNNCPTVILHGKQLAVIWHILKEPGGFHSQDLASTAMYYMVTIQAIKPGNLDR
jgi:hypothetical protein